MAGIGGNPFAGQPINANGQRGFTSILTARANAVANAKTGSFALMRCKDEFAWVSPAEVFLNRMARAVAAGIALIEMGKR